MAASCTTGPPASLSRAPERGGQRGEVGKQWYGITHTHTHTHTHAHARTRPRPAGACARHQPWRIGRRLIEARTAVANVGQLGGAEARSVELGGRVTDAFDLVQPEAALAQLGGRVPSFLELLEVKPRRLEILGFQPRRLEVLCAQRAARGTHVRAWSSGRGAPHMEGSHGGRADGTIGRHLRGSRRREARVARGRSPAVRRW